MLINWLLERLSAYTLFPPCLPGLLNWFDLYRSTACLCPAVIIVISPALYSSQRAGVCVCVYTHAHVCEEKCFHVLFSCVEQQIWLV